MLTRLWKTWLRLRESLWFVPATMTMLAVVAAFATMWLDQRVIAAGYASELWFVFGLGAEGVRGVLSAIAGSIITVTGVVFSINIVALQLASTQFTPRLLRTFLEDRANHVVLGVFIATFTYALVILRFVRADSERVTAFVPSISVTVAMGLALASIGCLIYFIDHSAHSIRASTIIERMVHDAVETARNVFPAEFGVPASPSVPFREPAGGGPTVVRATARGYLQLVDEDALLASSGSGPLTIRMEGRIGDYFRTGDVLASVWAEDADVRPELEGHVRAAFVLGQEPTGPQDVALGISRLVEIAVKALSPGINDPGTAMMCIDGLGEVLVVAGGRSAQPDRTAQDGRVQILARRPTFDELAALAFAQIRHHGAGTPAVAERLLQMARAVARRVPASRREPLLREAGHVARAAAAAIRDPEDRARIAALAATLQVEEGVAGI